MNEDANCLEMETGMYVEIMCMGDIRLDTRMEVVGKWRFFF